MTEKKTVCSNNASFMTDSIRTIKDSFKVTDFEEGRVDNGKLWTSLISNP